MNCSQAVTIEAGEFASLLQKEFRPKTDRARTEVENAVRTLAEQALGAGRGARNLVALFIGTGVGGGNTRAHERQYLPLWHLYPYSGSH